SSCTILRTKGAKARVMLSSTQQVRAENSLTRRARQMAMPRMKGAAIYARYQITHAELYRNSEKALMDFYPSQRKSIFRRGSIRRPAAKPCQRQEQDPRSQQHNGITAESQK